MPYRFHSSAHERLRVDERNLSLENMKATVNYPGKVRNQRPGVRGGTVKRFEKTVDGRTLVVVAEVKGHECWLMTGFILGE
jgi:hypothetical protein